MLNNIINKKTQNKDITNKETRNSIGILAAIIGIITNFILIVSKLSIGLIINSVSIIGNAIDSISDFGANVITLLGFKIASKPADSKHPFGHQRIEYVSGLIVSLLICFIGGSLLITSIEKLIENEAFSITNNLFYITLTILVITIIIKLYQYSVYSKLSKLIKSENLKDNAVDSLTDIITSVVIIVGLVINYLLYTNNKSCPFSLDGALGVIEAILILISGIKLTKAQTDLIIGTPADKAYVKQIDDFIKSYDLVLGTHDIICHKYGEGSIFMTVHVEVDENSNFKEIDEYTENIENQVLKKFNVNLTIHMDPTNVNDPYKKEIEEKLTNAINQINSGITFHDLRIITKHEYTILVFDLLIPFDFKYEEEELKSQIYNLLDKKYVISVNFDHSFLD